MSKFNNNVPIEGDIYKGKVVKIAQYGAFIEIEGYKSHGLVHISQIARDRVNSVEDVISISDEVYVKVLKIEMDENGRDKISLSMKYCDQVCHGQLYIVVYCNNTWLFNMLINIREMEMIVI